MINYRADLKIDRYNLEEELIRQPQLYMQWAIKSANATIEKEEAKNKLEVVKADIDKEIRSDPERYGFPDGKATEAGVKLQIAKHKRVKRYTKLYLEALRDEKILAEAKTAFHHRKKMLESLVSLNVQLHFAEPRVPLTKQDTAFRSRSDDIRGGLKRRKRRLNR